jgi:hypothetical protein
LQYAIVDPYACGWYLSLQPVTSGRMSAEFGRDQAIYGRKTGTCKPDSNLSRSIYFISKIETKLFRG